MLIKKLRWPPPQDKFNNKKTNYHEPLNHLEGNFAGMLLGLTLL